MRNSLAWCLAALFLSACAGQSVPPLKKAAQSNALQSVQFNITVPQRSVSAQSKESTRRTPAYISASTKSASISVQSAQSSPLSPVVINCTTTCTGEVPAPVGSDTFTVSLFDQAGGAGNILSTGATTATVLVNQANTIGVTFNGVVHSVSLAATTVPAGTPTSEPLSVIAKDAQNNVIIGPGRYLDAGGNPLTLTLSNADFTSGGSGKISLSPTAVSAPSDAVTITYNGGAMYNSTFSVSTNGNVPGGVSGTLLLVNPAVVQKTQVGSRATKLTVGSDGNIWYAEHFGDQIGTAKLGGSYSEYMLPPFADMAPGEMLDPGEIVTAGDGNVWFNFEGFSTSGNNDSGIGRITPAGVMTLYRDPNPGGTVFPIGLAVGSDGNLWFSEANKGAVGKMTTAGVATDYPLPDCNGGYNGPTQVTLGTDGNIWISDDHCVAKVTPSGAGAVYVTPSSAGSNGFYPDAITTGPDGHIWFTETTQNGGPPASKIAMIDANGSITEYIVPPNHWAMNLVSGPDGNLWFVDGYDTTRVGTMSTKGAFTFYTVSSAADGINAMLPNSSGDFYVTTGYSPASVAELVY